MNSGEVRGEEGGGGEGGGKERPGDPQGIFQLTD